MESDDGFSSIIYQVSNKAETIYNPEMLMAVHTKNGKALGKAWRFWPIQAPNAAEKMFVASSIQGYK